MVWCQLARVATLEVILNQNASLASRSRNLEFSSTKNCRSLSEVLFIIKSQQITTTHTTKQQIKKQRQRLTITIPSRLTQMIPSSLMLISRAGVMQVGKPSLLWLISCTAPALQLIPIHIPTPALLQLIIPITPIGTARHSSQYGGGVATRHIHINPYTGKDNREEERERQRKTMCQHGLKLSQGGVGDFSATIMDRARSRLKASAMQRRRRRMGDDDICLQASAMQRRRRRMGDNDIASRKYTVK